MQLEDVRLLSLPEQVVGGLSLWSDISVFLFHIIKSQLLGLVPGFPLFKLSCRIYLVWHQDFPIAGYLTPFTGFGTRISPFLINPHLLGLALFFSIIILSNLIY